MHLNTIIRLYIRANMSYRETSVNVKKFAEMGHAFKLNFIVD